MLSKTASRIEMEVNTDDGDALVCFAIPRDGRETGETYSRRVNTILEIVAKLPTVAVALHRIEAARSTVAPASICEMLRAIEARR